MTHEFAKCPAPEAPLEQTVSVFENTGFANSHRSRLTTPYPQSNADPDAHRKSYKNARETEALAVGLLCKVVRSLLFVRNTSKFKNVITSVI